MVKAATLAGWFDKFAERALLVCCRELRFCTSLT